MGLAWTLIEAFEQLVARLRSVWVGVGLLD